MSSRASALAFLGGEAPRPGGSGDVMTEVREGEPADRKYTVKQTVTTKTVAPTQIPRLPADRKSACRPQAAIPAMMTIPLSSALMGERDFVSIPPSNKRRPKMLRARPA